MSARKISNIQLVFCSILATGLALSFFALAFSVVNSGEENIISTIYFVIFAVVSFLTGAGIILSGKYSRVFFAISLVLALESLFAAKFAFLDGRHHVATAAADRSLAKYMARYGDRFSFHPMLAGAPTPNFTSEEYNHTPRSTRVSTRDDGSAKKTILAIGGSTVYGGQNDLTTWPSLLSTKIDFQIVNMGVPGYSTAEHVVQTAFYVPEYEPSCAIYYIGWNDIRSVGVIDVMPDYSGFHLRRQISMLGVAPNALLIYRFNPLENIAIYADFINQRRTHLQKYLDDNYPWWRNNDGAGHITSEVDARALHFFKRNIENIISLNRDRGVRTVLIPQVMNYEILTSEEPLPWTPFLRANAMKDVFAVYNLALLEYADEPNVWALDHVLSLDWRKEHFVDEGHFTPEGSEQFAAAIAEKISEICI